MLNIQIYMHECTILYMCWLIILLDINWGSSTQAHVYRNALIHTQKLVMVVEHVKNYRYFTTYIFHTF